MENLVIPLVSSGRVERGCVWRDSFIPLVSSGRVKRGCVWRDSFIPLVSSGREERLCLRKFVYTSSVFVSCRCKCVILFATMLHSLLSFSHLFIEREGMLMQILLLWFGEHTLKVFYFLLYEKNCVICRIFYPFRITSIFFHFFNRHRFFSDHWLGTESCTVTLFYQGSRVSYLFRGRGHLFPDWVSCPLLDCSFIILLLSLPKMVFSQYIILLELHVFDAMKLFVICWLQETRILFVRYSWSIRVDGRPSQGTSSLSFHSGGRHRGFLRSVLVCIYSWCRHRDVGFGFVLSYRYFSYIACVMRLEGHVSAPQIHRKKFCW